MKIIGKIPDGYIVNVSSNELANIAGRENECDVAYTVEYPHIEYRFNDLKVGCKIDVSEIFIDSKTVLSSYKELKSKFESVTTQLNTLLDLMDKSTDIKVDN